MKLLAFTMTTATILSVATTPASAGKGLIADAGDCTSTGTIIACHGTTAAIRSQSADVDRYVEFGVNSDGTRMMTGKFWGSAFSCIAPPTQSWADAFAAAMSANAAFVINFDRSTGLCTYLWVANGSAHKNASAL